MLQNHFNQSSHQNVIILFGLKRENLDQCFIVLLMLNQSPKYEFEFPEYSSQMSRKMQILSSIWQTYTLYIIDFAEKCGHQIYILVLSSFLSMSVINLRILTYQKFSIHERSYRLRQTRWLSRARIELYKWARLSHLVWCNLYIGDLKVEWSEPKF